MKVARAYTLTHAETPVAWLILVIRVHGLLAGVGGTATGEAPVTVPVGVLSGFMGCWWGWGGQPPAKRR
ncbi:MAG TPA: hypothetical protein PK869_09510 [Candidatus Hydrogenedentes bacterium]|nr:hypothetical protein [Candidatus Hydrogenedentota bacterium]